MFPADFAKKRVKQYRLIALREAEEQISNEIESRANQGYDYLPDFVFDDFQIDYDEDRTLLLSILREAGYNVEIDDAGNISVSWEQTIRFIALDLYKGVEDE